MYVVLNRRADVVKFGGGFGRSFGKLQAATEFRHKLETMRVNAFIDVGAVINVGVGIIVAGIIMLILAYISPEISNQLANSTSVWASVWTNISDYGKTAFTFIGLGFIVGGAVYILRLTVGSLRNLF